MAAPNANRVLPPPEGKVVAISEVNDLLTYELVPYLRYLWLRGDEEPSNGIRTLERLDSASTQQEIAAGFGMDVVDVRTVFTGKVLGVVPITNPLVAHTGHADQRELIQLMLCGADNGKMRTSKDGCMAAK